MAIQQPRRRSPVALPAEQTVDRVSVNAGEVTGQIDADDPERARAGGLVDLSILPRSGFRGPHAADHIRACGLPLPQQINRSVQADSGEWVMRLGSREYWVIASLADRGESMASLPAPGAGAFDLYRQDSHAWFVLTGAHLPAVFAKLCGVDLRDGQFTPGKIAQTQVARVNAIIANQPTVALPMFSVFVDSAVAQYLWDVFVDALAEFDGGPVGLFVFD